MYRHAVQGDAKLSHTYKPWCYSPRLGEKYNQNWTLWGNT